MLQRFHDRSVARRRDRRSTWEVTEGAGGKKSLRSRPCMAAAFAEQQNRMIGPAIARMDGPDLAPRFAAR